MVPVTGDGLHSTVTAEGGARDVPRGQEIGGSHGRPEVTFSRLVLTLDLRILDDSCAKEGPWSDL